MSLKTWIFTFILAIILYVAVVVFVPKITKAKIDASPRPSKKVEKVEGESPSTSSNSRTVEQTRHFAPKTVAPGEIPDFINDTVVSASLQALEKNGADLSKPMPSTHRVRCENHDAVAMVTRWAKSAGFTVSEPEMVHLHGGIENFMVDLVKTNVPDLASIQNTGRKVARAAHDLDGVTYATWVGAIVR